MLTQKELKRLLIYDRFTGKFYWKSGVSNVLAKSEAGTNKDGYVQIGIAGKVYRGHLLAWLYEYGHFSKHIIDHRDRDRSNNRMSNLREVSHRVNSRNTKTSVSNTSGIKGISWIKRDEKWYACIRLKGKTYNLGRHACKTEAVSHRLAAEDCLDWHLSDANTSARQYMKEYLESLK